MASTTLLNDKKLATPRPTEYVVCNYCGQDKPQNIFDIQSFSIVRCGACGLVYTNPRLSAESLKAVYNQEYFQSPNSLVHGYQDYAADRAAIQRTFGQRWERMKKQSGLKTGKLLDVGCAYGFMLDLARKDGWDVQGVDASEEAVAYATGQLGLSVRLDDLASFNYPDHHFDMVVLWDVIEHLPNPDQALRDCFRVLKPGGWLSLITPDQSSLCARFFKDRWVEYQKPHEHIYFFSRPMMRAFLKRAGFRTEWIGTAGKHVTLGFTLERLSAYQPWLIRPLSALSKRLGVDAWTLKVNPFDKMFLMAQKPMSIR